MSCMPLTGPLSGAGVGYCTDTHAIKGRDAAKEYYVAKRHTVAGIPCRLPMIAGCASCYSLSHTPRQAVLTAPLYTPALCLQCVLILPFSECKTLHVSLANLHKQTLGPAFGGHDKAITGLRVSGNMFGISRRLTLSSGACRGNLLLDCTKANGKEVCFPEGSEVPAECAPDAQPVTAALSSLMNAGQVTPPTPPILHSHPLDACRAASQGPQRRTTRCMAWCSLSPT